MGSILIWIAAALAYGAVCAAIFTLIRQLQGARNPLRRAAISFCAFTATGLIIIYILWLLFSI